jgi:hypothetical protein
LLKIGVAEPIALSSKRFCIWERLMTASESSGYGAIEVFDEDAGAMEQLKLFAAERRMLATAPDRVEVRL